jgi:hypothetical protein
VTDEKPKGTSLKKVSVTYKAPPGDSKVIEAFGHTFYHGKAEDVTVDERTLGKLRNNKHFEVGKETDVDAAKPDPAAEKAADEAAQKEDEAKLAAQGGPPPQRGAVLNKPVPPAEDEHKKEDTAKHGKGFQEAETHKK